jgi:hypothetical protein
MRRPSLVLATVFLCALLACKEVTPSWKQHSFTQQDMSRTTAESYLPRSLFEKMTSLLDVDGKKVATPGKGPLPSVFAPLKVYLVEKNRGILTHGHTEILYPAGGGDLDLRDFVQQKNGSFYFVAEFMPDLAASDRHVFFLSHAEQRVVGGEKFGGGCHSYFDITGAFNNSMKTEGYLVNTSEARHVSALAGTFYFAAVREGKLYLASLTVKDSSFPKLQCASIKPDPHDAYEAHGASDAHH